MDHYLDIRLLPDPEFVPSLLMNALYAKLHKILAQLGCSDIGVSFPEYDATIPRLGIHLRLHGQRQSLEVLIKTNWLRGMRDHAYVSNILSVPPHAAYCIVRRMQTKSNVERIRRRYVRRHNVSIEEARIKITDEIQRRLKLPFITLRSKSTEQTFRLFIHQEKIEGKQQAGEFSAYGLSKVATLPLF